MKKKPQSYYLAVWTMLIIKEAGYIYIGCAFEHEETKEIITMGSITDEIEKQANGEYFITSWVQ